MKLSLAFTAIFTVFFLAGCAGDATRSSSPWQSSHNYLFVAPISPGLYKLDEFYTTHLGLKQLLEANIAMGVRPEIVIYAPLKKNYATQADIARLAEDLDLTVYRYSLFGYLDINSKTLLELAGDSSPSHSE